MLNMDGANKFHFNWKDLVPSGLSVKDAIAPTALAFKNSRTFQMGGIFGAVSFLNITASDLSDQLLKDFLDMDSSQIVTMHIQSVDQNKAIKTIKHTITELDRSKIEEQKKAVRAGYDMDVLPSDLATYGRDAKALLKELQSQNERMFLVTFLVLNTGKTEQELETNVFQAVSIAQKHNCELCRLDFQQEQGLMSSLPLADCQIEIQRGLTTSSTAIFVPFTTQELFDNGKESLYYGLNALSNNLIMVDRKKLKNPNGLILGTPGSGKSFSAKREICNAFLVTDDDILVCDPESEYAPLVERLHGQVIHISPSSTQYINPINEQEAAVVRIVFDKYVYEGYGPQHIATYLNNSGYRARSGKCWHPSSIRGMVQNLTYTGVLRCGDARSELMPDLQIVPQEQFENAQRIRNERSVRSTAEAENRLPLNIHGKSLLAGNAYCGHCGAKLELTSSRKWRKMADGSLDDTLRIRYTCYGKLRKQTNCTGQTGYTVHILDEIIDKAVRQIFSKMRGIPKEQIVTKRYEKETTERKNHLQDLQTQRDKAEKDLLSLKAEILACIKGESVLPRETLAEMITEQEEKLKELEDLCESASEELERTAELMDKVSRLYDELISYADLYDSANFEAKKMVVNQLIRRVDVYRGYQINISFNFDLTPYIEGE